MSRSRKKRDGKVFQVGNHVVTVEDTLNEGGFAVVFLVKDEKSRRWAMKRIRINSFQDFLQVRFEAETMKNMSHVSPFVVRYIDDNLQQVSSSFRKSAPRNLDTPKEVLILTEYYPRNVIQLINEKLVERCGLTENEVLNIFCDVCAAVGVMHSRDVPIIHRDLKIENILISNTGKYVLCDFGSATDRIQDPRESGVGPIQEELERYTTIAYRAPEMVNLYNNQPITTKADIWALGVMLYKLCFLKDPFENSALAIANAKYHIPEEHHYRKEVIALIRVCLTSNPEQRPDIYQVASAACDLINRGCNVGNRNESEPLDLKQLAIEAEESEMGCASMDPASISEQLLAESCNQNLSRPQPHYIETTTITPRERPKALSRSSAPSMMAPVMVPTIVTSENSVSAAAADASSYIYTKGSSFQNKEDGEAKISPAEVEELFRSQYPDPFQNDVVENHVTNLQTTPLPTSKPLAEKTTISKTDKPAHNNDLPNVQETSKLVEQQAPIDPIVKQAKVKKNFAYKTFSNLSDESDEDVRNDVGRDFSDRYYASEDEEDEEVPDEVKKVRDTKKPLELSVSSRARVDVVGGQEPFPIISPPKKKDSGARKLVRREERIVATKSVGAVNPDDDPFANAPGFGQRTTAVRAQALASLDGNVPSCSRQSFSGVSNASVFAAATRKSSDASARAAYNPFVCSNNSSNSSLDQIKPGSSSASTPTNLNEAVRPSTDAFGAAPFNPQPGAKALVKKRAASLACASSSSSQQSHTHHPAAVQCSTKETRSATKDTTIIRQIAQHHHSQAHPMVHQRTKLPQALRSKHAQIDSKLPTKGISNISFDDS